MHACRAQRYAYDETTDEIGNGAHGRVFRAIDLHENGREVAVKVVGRPDHATSFKREFSAMLCLNHENIMRMLDMYVTGPLHIVYEFVSNGDLFEWITGKYKGYKLEIGRIICSRTTTRIARQMGKALAYCHAQGIAHRDFKPDNVLVCALEPDILLKVMDFGLSYGIAKHEAASRTTMQLAGSPEYAAPELFIREASDAIDPYAADVWSYGVTMFVVAHGYYPCAMKDIVARWHRSKQNYILPNNMSREIATFVPPGLRSILVESLQWKPRTRATMEELAADDRIGGIEARSRYTICNPFDQDLDSDSDSDSDSEAESELHAGTREEQNSSEEYTDSASVQSEPLLRGAPLTVSSLSASFTMSENSSDYSF